MQCLKWLDFRFECLSFQSLLCHSNSDVSLKKTPTKRNKTSNQPKQNKKSQTITKPNQNQRPKTKPQFFLCVIFPRESIYRLLPQTTPENVSKNFSHYSIDPATRYPNINVNFLRPQQVNSNWCCSVLLVMCSVFPQAKLVNVLGAESDVCVTWKQWKADASVKSRLLYLNRFLFRHAWFW